jgi:Ca2+-transporting ATPase
MAYRPVPQEDSAADVEEKELVFAGLVGMADPPKGGVREAVDKCRKAGVKVLMITGDHPATAVAVAGQLGILRKGGILTGSEIEAISDEELGNCLEETEVCARTTPEQKLRLVRALKRNGHIVAMTGDGINDAPAVKEANVGIAMGLKGTEVTKGASSLVLTDDNFATIVEALEEGRAVGDNIRSTIRYLLPGNLGEIIAILGSSLTGSPLPLLPSQILFVNLITESIPAMALGAKPPENGALEQPPRKPDSDIVSDSLQNRILVRGILTGLTTFGVFKLVGHDLARARTMAFANLVTSQGFNLLNCQNGNREKNPYLLPTAGAALALTLATLYVPFIRPLFQTVPLGIKDWAILLASSVLINKTEDVYEIVTHPRKNSGRLLSQPLLPT